MVLVWKLLEDGGQNYTHTHTHSKTHFIILVFMQKKAENRLKTMYYSQITELPYS